jgi:hypothetical protein
MDGAGIGRRLHRFAQIPAEMIRISASEIRALIFSNKELY